MNIFITIHVYLITSYLKFVIKCETLCPWQQQNPKKVIDCVKVKAKVTRSLTLFLFERISLVEYYSSNVHAKYKVSIYSSKVIAKVILIVDNKQTNCQANIIRSRGIKRVCYLITPRYMHNVAKYSGIINAP